MENTHLLERRGPRDKRGRNSRFDFDHVRQQLIPFVFFRVSQRRIFIEIDVFSIRNGWVSDDPDKWEDEKIELRCRACRTDFFQAWRLIRGLLHGRSATFDKPGMSLLSLDRLHPDLAYLKQEAGNDKG